MTDRPAHRTRATSGRLLLTAVAAAAIAWLLAGPGPVGRTADGVAATYPLPVAALTLAPATDVSDVNRNRPYVVTATLTNAVPPSGRRILFSVTGAHTRAAAASTGASGTATFRYVATTVGTDTVSACFDQNSNAACGAGEPVAKATKTWVFGLDQFRCYDVAPTDRRARTVLINDDIDQLETRVGRRRTLCNPVSLNGATLISPTAHLTCYATNDVKRFKSRTRRITDRFGSRAVRLLRPQSLCIPSLTRSGAGAPPAGRFPTRLLDHFRCYGVRAVGVARRVGLRDGFGTSSARVMQLTQVCNPAGQIDGRRLNGVRRPPAHLACYSIRDMIKLPRRVVVRNEYETKALRAVRARTLCLPSLVRSL